MQIKIFNQSQLALLRNINSLLKKRKIPREILHELGYILEFKKVNNNDYIVLFTKPLKNDLIDIFDKLNLYKEDVDNSNDNFHIIEIKGKKHPMKKNRIWSCYEIFVPADDRIIFVIYSMKKKHLDRKGGF